MMDDFQRLQEVGLEQIHNDTHIAISHIKAVLERDYEKLNKVQFLGFLSIIEREYDLDLSEEKELGLAFFKEKDALHKGSKVFIVVEDEEKKSKLPYIVIIILFIVIGAFLTLNYGSTKLKEIVSTKQILSSVHQEIPLSLEKKVVEKNETKSTDVEQIEEQETQQTITEEKKTSLGELKQTVTPQKEVQNSQEKFVIVPQRKLWLGYIDLQENKKHQKIIKEALELNASKEWLLFLGHSYVTIEVDDNNISYKNKKSIRLLYKDGKLKKITTAEFKELNRGRKW